MRVLKIGRVVLAAALLCGTTAMAAPKATHVERALKAMAPRSAPTRILYEEGCYEGYFNHICIPRCHDTRHPKTDQQIYQCMEDCVVEASLACNPPEE